MMNLPAELKYELDVSSYEFWEANLKETIKWREFRDWTQKRDSYCYNEGRFDGYAEGMADYGPL